MSNRNLRVVIAGLLSVGIAAGGCSTTPSATAVPTASPPREGVALTAEPTAPPQASGIPEASPSVRPTPTPAPDPRPSISYPDSESHGTLTISFEVPAVASLTADLVCTWGVGPLLSGLSGQSGGSGNITGTLTGEEVYFGLDPLPRWEGDPLFEIYHLGAVYRPGPTTGTEELAKTAPDWASGTIRLRALPLILRAPIPVRCRARSPIGFVRSAVNRRWPV